MYAPQVSALSPHAHFVDEDMDALLTIATQHATDVPRGEGSKYCQRQRCRRVEVLLSM